MAFSRRYKRICRFILIGALSYLGFYTIQVSSADHHAQNNRIGVNHNQEGYAFKNKKSRRLHPHPHQDQDRPTSIYPRGGASLQPYRDVLQLSQRSSRLKNRQEFDGHSSSLIDHWDSSPNDDEVYVFSRNKRSTNEVSRSPAEADNATVQPKGIPVVYRYFGRSRARSVRSDSIPFIVVGPSVDHWKLVGRILASRGFNVMAIERANKDKETSDGASTKGINHKKKLSSDDGHDVLVEGEALVSTILNVLKWQRAILVGCDEESVLAIEAALRLAPDRIVGLVLCGDLSSFQKHVQEQINNMKNYASCDDDDSIDIDSFLNHYVECPCSIVWDGDASTWSSAGEDYPASSSITKVIHGGGMAPHRRLPEQFAWTLTRFVEKKVSILPPPPTDNIDTIDTENENENTPTPTATATESSWKNHNIWKETSISQILTPGTLLVSGRILATTIIYISIARVSIFQYKNIRDIQLSWFHLSKRQIVQNLFSRIRNIKLSNPFTLSVASLMDRMTYIFLRGKKESALKDVDTEKIEVHSVDEDMEDDTVENIEDIEADKEENSEEEKSTMQESDSPSTQKDNGDDENETPKLDSTPSDDGEENGGNNPLLHKLLFFDHIIS